MHAISWNLRWSFCHGVQSIATNVGFVVRFVVPTSLRWEDLRSEVWLTLAVAKEASTNTFSKVHNIIFQQL